MTIDFPPHEARGGLGNIMDPGGGGNTLKPSPLPNAIAGGGPGLSTAAGNYPGGPTVPGADPQALALLVAQLAGEWFGGSSLAPTPSASSGWTSSGASLPVSPGFSPALVAATPTGMAGSDASMPGGSSALAMPAFSPTLVDANAPAASGGAPSANASPLGGGSPHGGSSGASPHGGSSDASPHGGSSGASHGGPSAPRGGISNAFAPTSNPSTSSSSASSSSGSRGASQSHAGPPTSAHGTDSMGKGGVSSASVPSGSRSGGASRSGGSTSGPTSASTGGPNPVAGTNARHANPSQATPMSSDVGNPFDVPPDLGAIGSGLMPFADLRMPVIGGGDAMAAPLDAGAFDTSVLDPGAFASGAEASDVPYFVPSAASAPAIGPSGYEVPAADEGLIRELGGVAFDPYRVRRDFPILDEQVRGKRLVWLDNAATTQKPMAVIERLSEFYKHENSNIHRAAHTLAARATDAYEKARGTTREFLNAPSTNDIIFVRGATEGINLIAQSWGRKNIGAGDEIVITHLEHHANIVPWQMLCSEKGARLRVAPVDDRGDVILEEYEKLLGPKTKLVALPQVSNALGTITPTREMVEMAHRYGARVMVDGAQAVSHMRVDVQMLDCDWYVFSGHKVFAPTGIGVVFGKGDVLSQMPPWQGGGNMIQDVTFERTTYQPPPFRFEAGTGNIADAAGLGAALEYVMRIGMDTIDRYEHDLLVYATERLAYVPGLKMIGTSPNKAGVLSFVLEGQRTEDVGAALDQDGIAVRSGHHCAQPILRRFGVEATVRASLAFYNICEDIDALVDALMRMQAGHARR